MRQLQWNSIREISVSIYYRQNYQAGFSQPAPPANWLHTLQRLFHTIRSCRKNAPKFSSFFKKSGRMVQTQEKIPYSAPALCLSSRASQGWDSVKPPSAGRIWAPMQGLGSHPGSLLKSAVEHMSHLNFSWI